MIILHKQYPKYNQKITSVAKKCELDLVNKKHTKLNRDLTDELSTSYKRWQEPPKPNQADKEVQDPQQLPRPVGFRYGNHRGDHNTISQTHQSSSNLQTKPTKLPAPKLART